MGAILQITDGTTTIDLLDKEGFLLRGWQQQIPGLKGDGVWSDSPVADWRQLALAHYANVVDEFQLTVNGNDIDDVVLKVQELLRLLVAAKDYWTSRWVTTPVYIKAQAACETNPRYTVIESFRVPDIPSPYEQPFLQPKGESTIDDLSLFIEHGPWLANVPGSATCVEISAEQSYCYPSYLEFDGASAWDVNCGSDASIDDLPDGASITFEAWVLADGYGGIGGTLLGRIFDKTGAAASGWMFYISYLVGLETYIYFDTVNATASSGLDELTADGEWHHVAMVYNDTGDRKIYLFIDGTPVASYSTQVPAQGAYVSDAANDLIIGNRSTGDATFEGRIGWCRLSSEIRYPAGIAFTPPLRCVLPPIDGFTVAQWIYEGQGSTVDNMEGTAAADGTITGATWDCDCIGDDAGEYSGTFYPALSADDCFTGSTGTINLVGNLDFGYSIVQGHYSVGMRFRNVTIPRGATIKRARVRGYISGASVTPYRLAFINGEDNSNPAIFSTYADFVARTRTTASIPYGTPLVAPTVGQVYDFPDISAIIQEIVDRADWASGNDLVVFIESFAPAVADTLSIDSFDTGPPSEALIVNWEVD